MASSAIEQLVKSELGHYPGVKLEIKDGRRHDKAVFHFGNQSRFLTLPKTPSDWRANANIKRDLKKTLKELGVERSYHKSVQRRGGKGRRHRNAVAAVALNKNNLVLLIPVNSKLLDRFKSPDGKPAATWEFEIRSSPDLQAPPLIAVKRVTMPPGMAKRWGMTRGTMHKSGGWVLAIKRTQVPALAKKVDSIGSIDVQLYADEGKTLVFRLPAGVLPTSYHPHNDRLEAEAPIPSEAWPEPPQERVEEPAAPEVAKAAPEPQAGYQDRPIVLQMPKQSVSIEQAIALLNKRKQQLGNGLRFTIEEGGYLSAVHRIAK